jgi:hypothetical protein
MQMQTSSKGKTIEYKIEFDVEAVGVGCTFD